MFVKFWISLNSKNLEVLVSKMMVLISKDLTKKKKKKKRVLCDNAPLVAKKFTQGGRTEPEASRVSPCKSIAVGSGRVAASKHTTALTNRLPIQTYQNSSDEMPCRFLDTYFVPLQSKKFNWTCLLVVFFILVCGLTKWPHCFDCIQRTKLQVLIWC